MSYCINPWCPERKNPDDALHCQACDTPLLVNERYRLVRPLKELCTHSYTEVWLADYCGTLQVLKCLTESKPTLIKLFQREAQVLRQLSHPGIPKLETNFVFFPNNGPQKLHCLVLERLEGENLEQWVAANHPISQELAWEWLENLVEILDYVHQERFFHRDIKPSNIMRTPEGKLVLIDFGAVRKITGTYLEKMELQQETTGIYSIGGYTPAEQIIGRAVPQSDFFALGRTFVYLLTGKPPTEFENPDTGELVGWRETVPGLSGSFADSIDRLMAPVAQKRPCNTQEILQAIAESRDASDRVCTSQKEERYAKLGSWNFARKKELAFRFAPIVLLGCIGTFMLMTPKLAIVANKLGVKNHQEGRLIAAKQYYRLATRLNPQYAQPYYNLGWLCEESLNDRTCARAAYQQAILRQFPAANAELARLQILDNDLPAALKTTEDGLQWVKYDLVKAALLKNRGWIRFSQNRLEEAENDLRNAIALADDSPHSHCLLARVLQARGKPEALVAWRRTYEDSEYRVPEQDHCIALSRQQLSHSTFKTLPDALPVPDVNSDK